MEKSKLYYNFVLAICKNKGIGNKGSLPWKLPLDMTHFKVVTSKILDEQESISNFINSNMIHIARESFKSLSKKSHNSMKNIVVMGKNTWESIPQKFKPLSGRINIVLSKNEEFHKNHPTVEENFYSVKNLKEFFDIAENLKSKNILNEIYVIGGSQVYDEFIKSYPDQLKLIFQTYIGKEYECDTFYEIPKDYIPIHVSKTYLENAEPESPFDFRILLNPKILLDQDIVNKLPTLIDPYFLTLYPKSEELQYLEVLKDVIDNGKFKEDRTGIGTFSKFGVSMRFDCSQTFPLLTTKDTFWRGIVEELLWFIKGDTNSKNLSNKKVYIWDGNGSRQFLDSIGLNHREEGDLGPIYGFQWRHFGAEYINMHEDYSGKGVDQLINLIQEIKTNPNSRRLIISAWNVKDLKLMALPPCHALCQFYVSEGKLNLQMYQRSADLGLGVPFNIASYALLLRMVAHVTDMEVGDFVHVIGDAHVYKNHIDALKKQLSRTPKPFPILKINKEIKNIENFKFEDFSLYSYNPLPKIKMEMAV